MKTKFDVKPFLKQYGYLLIVLAIVLTGFWIRSIPAKYGELQALDPFYHYRMGEYVLANDWQMPELDMMRYYPNGVNPLEFDYLAPIYLPAYSYVALTTVGLSMSFYDWAIIWPAIMGALAVLGMFFLGKEMFNSKIAGFFAAFFLATIPAFITRTSAGFFEKEPIAGVFMIFGVYFFIYAFKKNSWKGGILSGISLAAMSTSWGGAAYMFLLYAAFVLILFAAQGIFLLINYIVPGSTKKIIDDLESKFDGPLLKAFIPTIVLGFFLHQIYLKHFIFSTAYIQLGFVGVGLLLIRYIIKNYAVIKLKLLKSDIVPYIIPALLVLSIFVLVFGSMFYAPFNKLLFELSYIAPESRGLIGTTVAENAQGNWDTVVSMLTTSFSAPVLPLLSGIAEFFAVWFLMLFGIFLLFYEFVKTRKWIYIFLLLWIISGIWGIFSMVRLAFLLGPPAALCAAFFLHWIVKRIQNLDVIKSAETLKSKLKIYYISIPLTIALCLCILFNLTAGFVYVNQLGPSLNSYWKESMTFLAEETPEDSVILSWWDFGYFFQTVGKRASVADGGNMVPMVDETLADWFTTPTDNWNDWIPWLKEHGVSHIVMDYTLPGKYGAISKIGSRGEQIYGFIQFQQTDTIQREDGVTVIEFRSGQYVIWLPVDLEGNVNGMPMFLIAQGDQFIEKLTLTKICSEGGITDLGEAEDEMGGCLYVGDFGIFYILPELMDNVFVDLMFLEGSKLPVEKVFDNSAIKIYEVKY